MTAVESNHFGPLLAGITRAFADGDQMYLAKAEETTNVELLRIVFSHLLEGRPAEFSACLAEDVVFEVAGFPIWSGLARGREAVMAAVKRNFSMLDAQIPEVKQLVAQGNQVVLLLEERGRFAGTGGAYHFNVAQWFTFHEGKIARIHEIIGSVG